MPTKIGELLACGRPVVVNRGLGDMDEIVSRFDCGVLLEEGSDAEELDRAAGELGRLVDDAGTAGRCRAAAEAHFDLEGAVDALVEAYHEISSPLVTRAPL